MPSFLLEHQPIGQYSGYKTNVVADYFFELKTEEDLDKLHEAYLFATKNNVPFLIIGGGTNLLFSSSVFAGVVIKNSMNCWEYNSEKQMLHAYSNESIWDIADSLEVDYNQPIWHRFIGLPGSVGGAIFGNAGCFGLETESNFVRATVYDMNTGVRKNISKEDMGFSYRHSFLKENPNLFIIGACFDLSVKIEKYSSDVDNLYFREHQQPKGNSCGSFFKNPSREISAGALIESVGLKGHQHGGARWSSLHANFLMSDGASCLPSDLIELVRLTQEKVKKEKGFDLINEVRII
ncbi:FAD-binding protein [Candidatus Gracilibacteria bacterium]|nr:FAD-binding protein [Candidatus Gracilibacteria bacterium]